MKAGLYPRLHTWWAVRRPADMLLWVALEVPLTSLVDSCTTLLTYLVSLARKLDTHKRYVIYSERFKNYAVKYGEEIKANSKKRIKNKPGNNYILLSLEFNWWNHDPWCLFSLKSNINRYVLLKNLETGSGFKNNFAYLYLHAASLVSSCLWRLFVAVGRSTDTAQRPSRRRRHRRRRHRRRHRRRRVVSRLRRRLLVVLELVLLLPLCGAAVAV